MNYFNFVVLFCFVLRFIKLCFKDVAFLLGFLFLLKICPNSLGFPVLFFLLNRIRIKWQILIFYWINFVVSSLLSQSLLSSAKRWSFGFCINCLQSRFQSIFYHFIDFIPKSKFDFSRILSIELRFI